MLKPGSPLADLINAPMRPGRIAWVGARPARRAAMQPLTEAQLDTDSGLISDRYSGRSGERHLTLIGASDLAAIAEFLGLDAVAPDQLRRNVVISGVNLLALKDKRFRLGAALLQTTGECHPCSRMEEIFGREGIWGGYNAVRGHGGITARVLQGGLIRIGDALEVA